MNTFKKILGIVLDVFIVLIFVMSIIVIIFSSNKNPYAGNTELFGKTFLTVESDSMDAPGEFYQGKNYDVNRGFKVGDIIICDIFDINKASELKEGDVISFLDVKNVNGSDVTVINTHRIVEIDSSGATITIRTKGDNEEFIDPVYRVPAEIIAVWHGEKIPVLGGILTFLKQPVGFICCLVIPILAIIGYQAYKLIVIYVSAKQSQMKEKLAKEGPTDEMKDAIIKEYLAKQQAESKKEDNSEEKQ